MQKQCCAELETVLFAFGTAVRGVKISAPGHDQLLLAGRMPICAGLDFAARCAAVTPGAAVLKHGPCNAIFTVRPTDFREDFLTGFKPCGALPWIAMAGWLPWP